MNGRERVIAAHLAYVVCQLEDGEPVYRVGHTPDVSEPGLVGCVVAAIQAYEGARNYAQLRTNVDDILSRPERHLRVVGADERRST